MRRLLSCLGLALLGVGSLVAAEKPNVLFIFADDLAFDAVGFMGNDEVKTPNLDRLSKRGTVFTHAYNSGAWHGAICVASRTMMMTGKQVWNAKKANLSEMVKKGEMLPQVMAKGGYETYFAGKWHIGNGAAGKASMTKQVFDHSRNVRAGMPRQVKSRYSRDFTKANESWSPYDKKLGGFWQGGKHWSEVLGDDAGLYFSKVKKDEKPFFMYLCFSAPHDPRQAPESFQKMYPYDAISVPANFMPTYPMNIGSNKIRDERLGPFPRTEHSIQVNRSEYYALITHMDEQIGKILDDLEKSGKADNTYIIFTADHGLACGHHGLLGKQNQYDPSVRVPWLIVGPGIPEGKRVDEQIYLQDAMATTLDLCGFKIPEYCEFKSVLPVIKGEAKGRDTVYGSYVYYQRMVRTDRYKLIVYPAIGEELLFDLVDDPLEMKNLAKDGKHAELLEEMRVKLREEMKAMGDPVDLKDARKSYLKAAKK